MKKDLAMLEADDSLREPADGLLTRSEYMFRFITTRNLLAVTGLIFLSAGCVSSSTRHDSNTSEVELTAPRYYSSYHELFKYIAQNELIPRDVASVDANSIIKMAADSEVEICHPEEGMPPLYLITPNYYLFSTNDPMVENAIRGEQGNGTYYLVTASRKKLAAAGNPNPGFELVGIATGNSYAWKNYANQTPRFVTSWHLGARNSPETVYEWDGKIFKLKKAEQPGH